MRTYEQLFVGGQWRDPAGSTTIEVISPHTEELIGRAPHADEADVDHAVAAARAAFDAGPWPRMTPAERAEVIAGLAGAYGARAEEIAAVVTDEMGSPILFSQRAQTGAAQALLQTVLRLAADHPWEETRYGMVGEVLVRREPVGVVAAIVPWNIPQLAILTKLVPALLAGCAVVLKPAPETPLDALLFAEVLEQIGLPEGVASILPAGREVGEYLVGHPGVDKVAFTGSTAAGRRVAAICGEQIKRVSLELGGKSAAIILDDADLATMTQRLKFASFMNSGQACVAQTRVLASRQRYDDVVEALADMTSSLKVGDPYDPETEVGPLVARRQQERVAGYIELGQAEGAKLVVGGAEPPEGLERGWYVAPTLFAEVDNGMRIAQEEIFGPVLAVIPYDDLDDAIRIANDSQYGLAGSVWTSDPERGMDVARRVRSGTYGINQYTSDFAAPFGGFKASGIGRESGPEGLDEYVELKSIALAPGP